MRVRRHMGWGIGLLLAVASATVAANGPDLRLIDAVKSKNKEAVRALLKQGGDVKARQGDGATALHWAAHWDDVETADLLIRAGAPVNAANDHGVTPLWLAGLNRNAAMTERLLKAGADPNLALSAGETPLMTASRAGNAEVVKLLLAHGANANAKESWRDQTALMWAAVHGHSDVVQMLVKHGADVHARSRSRVEDVGMLDNAMYITKRDVGGWTPLLFAAQHGDIESAQILLSAGAGLNETSPMGQSVLVIAAHSGRRDLAEWLLKRGADPNYESAGYTALHAAVARNDTAMVKALLAHGANPNVRLKQGTPARRFNHDYHLKPTWIGATPFWVAAQLADTEMMRVLVAGGADPQIGLNNGATPLMAAMIYNPNFYTNTVVPPKPGTAAPPAQAAAPAEEEEEGPVFIENDRRRGWTFTTLEREHFSLEKDEVVALATVKVAIDLGADVNAASGNGDTALHYAALNGLNTVVQFLVERGAKLDVKNKNGQTPLARTKKRKTAALLRQLGATE